MNAHVSMHRYACHMHMYTQMYAYLYDVFTRVCIHKHMTCICMHTDMCIHVCKHFFYMHSHEYTHIYTYTHVCTYVCIYIRMYTYIHVWTMGWLWLAG